MLTITQTRSENSNITYAVLSDGRTLIAMSSISPHVVSTTVWRGTRITSIDWGNEIGTYPTHDQDDALRQAVKIINVKEGHVS